MANVMDAKKIGAKLPKKAAAEAAAEYIAGSDAGSTLQDMARGLAARQVRFERSKAMAEVSADDVATGFWQRVKAEALASLIADGMSEDDAADAMTRFHKEGSLRVTVRQFLPFFRWLAEGGASLNGLGADTPISKTHAAKIVANEERTNPKAVAKALRAKGGITDPEPLIGIVGRTPGGSTNVNGKGGSDTDTDTDTDSGTDAPTPTPKRTVTEAAEALAAEFGPDELRSLAKALQAMAKRSEAAEAAEAATA